MKVVIASYGGRNWLLDTARELDSLGHEVLFYSYLPTKRALKFGLKRECNRSYYVVSLPFLMLLKFSNRANWALFIFHYFFDLYIGWFAPQCDVFIGQSPMHVFSLKNIKRKYNAKIILERGTSHVLEQIKALSTNPTLKGKSAMPSVFIKRDLNGYKLADYITIPSEVVNETFLKHNIPANKLFINPFGVNLKEFGPTILDQDNNYDLIMVGQWCHRKGCDLLIDVCLKYNYSLLHVGPIIDVKFPTQSNFHHVDAVDQKQLKQFYSMARVFVLPSREEGLALVQPQAVACGLPIVCSKFTGGRDLKKFIEDPKWIIEMEEYNLTELNQCIIKALELATYQVGLRNYSMGLENQLSWKAYGERYDKFIEYIQKSNSI